ncbi:MAG: hypothetical protein JWM74_5615 [Myxococcaceae bacterium]|jgi:hypothetical protein|nr:hypothetical protein [Myxococcaceae bacterium]
MSAIRRPHRARLVLAALFALAAMGAVSGACSLNPQPIPPGADPDAAFAPAPENGGPNDKGDTAADGSFADGAGAGSDAGQASDATATPNADGGDAGDAGDAIADAADGE